MRNWFNLCLTIPSFIMCVLSIVCNATVWNLSGFEMRRLGRSNEHSHHQKHHNGVTILRLIRLLAITGFAYNTMWLINITPGTFIHHNLCLEHYLCIFIGLSCYCLDCVDAILHSFIAGIYIYLLTTNNGKLIFPNKTFEKWVYGPIAAMLVVCCIPLIQIGPIKDIFPPYQHFYNYISSNGDKYYCQCFILGNFEYIWFVIVTLALMLHGVALSISCCYQCMETQGYRFVAKLLRPWLIVYLLTRVIIVVIRFWQKQVDFDDDQHNNVHLGWVIVHSLACSSIGVGNAIIWFRNSCLQTRVAHEKSIMTRPKTHYKSKHNYTKISNQRKQPRGKEKLMPRDRAYSAGGTSDDRSIATVHTDVF